MRQLDTPDLCARLDRMKWLCDRLEEAQDDRDKYRQLVHRIHVETEALHAAICKSLPKEAAGSATR
jgi:hypothetical protein